MPELLLHPSTERLLTDYQAQPTHALLLVGPTGSGKQALAQQLAETVLNIKSGSFGDYAYGLQFGIPNDKKQIGIETIRELEHFLSLKVPGTKLYSRVVIIQDAHALTHEAQNALLKTLEEPPTGTLLLLTVNHLQSLLPTIRSRAQVIPVTKPDEQSVKQYFGDQNLPDTAIRQAYAVSGGQPGLMHAMLHEEDHPLSQATAQARELLSKTQYERLLKVDELAKQKDLARDTAFILQQMAHVSLQTASGPAEKRWQNVLKASYQVSEALSQNVQPKLALSQLMLSL